MIAGLSVPAFTVLHVGISLLGITAGFVVMVEMLRSRPLHGWTALFLGATVLTSVTGFMFHSKVFGPPHVLGVLSLVVLAPALVGYYVKAMAGAWRWIFVVTALLAQYFNVFAGVVQAFQKIPALNALAPTQSEPPFQAAQGLILLIFIALTVLAVRRFHPERAAMAAAPA